MKFWIGKVNADTLGHKRNRLEYLADSLSTTKKDAEEVTEFLAGFAGWEVVELREVKKTKNKKFKK